MKTPRRVCHIYKASIPYTLKLTFGKGESRGQKSQTLSATSVERVVASLITVAVRRRADSGAWSSRRCRPPDAMAQSGPGSGLTQR